MRWIVEAIWVKWRRRIFYLSHTQYNQQWNVFSAFNPSKCTHTWSSGQPMLWRPGSSWRFSALLKGLTSVVDNSCRSRDSNPQPQITSPTLYSLGHDCYTVSYCHTHMLYIIMFYLNLFDIFFWLFYIYLKKDPLTLAFPILFLFYLLFYLFLFI